MNFFTFISENYKIMGREEIKLDLIQWLIETTDTETINRVQAIRNSCSGLTPTQDAILEKRMEKYEKGLMTFSPWHEAKARIVSKGKNAI